MKKQELTPEQFLTDLEAILFFSGKTIKQQTQKATALIESVFSKLKKDTLIDSEKERMKWSLDTFKEATALSSLRKCEEEIEEIEVNIVEKHKDPEEYADAIMCLFDSAGRDGITADQIKEAYIKKVAINKARKWVKNPNNTYSHVKPIK